MNIHLLHINDVHSQLENHLRLGAKLRRLRDEIRQRGEWVLTFDIGDTLDRVRPETEATMGRLNAALLGALGCDGWVFGNNEGLTIPKMNWAGLVDLAEAPVLCANLRDADGAAFPFFEDALVVEQGGVRIGVFGLTPNYERPYTVLGVQAIDPRTVAERTVAYLQSRSCDIVILLSHLGLRADMELAADLSGIDVILGGHTHQFMTEAVQVGQTTIFQPGKHGLVFGHTTIEYDEASHVVRRVVSAPIPVDVHGAFDQQMLSAWRGYNPDVEKALARPVAHLDTPLPVWLHQESPFANLLVDILFQRYPCDIGLMMAGALTASLLPGDVQVQHVLGACTTPTRPLLLRLTGEALLHIINQSVQPETYARPGFGFGFRGSVVGVLALANAEATLQRDAQGRAQVSALSIQGQPLDLNRWYRVVTCEYLWLAPVFPDFRTGRDVEFRAPLVRDLLLADMHDQRLLKGARRARYFG